MGKDLNIDHDGLVYLRCHFPDLYSDMHMMALHSFTLWRKSLIDDHFKGALDQMLELLQSKISPKAETDNRLYITTEFFIPVLIAPNLSTKSLSIINSNTRCSILVDELLGHSRNCMMAWLFQDRLLTMAHPITPTMAAEMIAAFSRENLISLAHIRPHWYLPR